jgi:hypothetical protein
VPFGAVNLYLTKGPPLWAPSSDVTEGQNHMHKAMFSSLMVTMVCAVGVLVPAASAGAQAPSFTGPHACACHLSSVS